jgi:hypothetical protein
MADNKPLVMTDYKSFAVTVQGGSHIKSGTVCQDASNCFNNESVSIAVVADGHGDSSCFRSDEGSKLAVLAAKNGIWQFVKEHEEKFKSVLLKKSNPPSFKELEKFIREQLIKQIVAKWNKDVLDHHKMHPFTDQELEKVTSEKYRKRYENEEGINKAYGTSLIAVAFTPWYWFGFHVGDGRFTILYEDGKGGQPIPWDPKCYLNVPTSICDEDILGLRKGENGEEGQYVFRAYLSLHSEKAPPVAFFCCSDGIDDNYPADEKENRECLYRLYREIAVTVAEDGYESTFGQDGKSGQLKELAIGFATKGKGDDTSLAGIVNIEKLKEVAPAWKERMAAQKERMEKAKTEANEKAKAEAEAKNKAEAEATARRDARKAEREKEEKVKAEAEKKVEVKTETIAVVETSPTPPTEEKVAKESVTSNSEADKIQDEAPTIEAKQELVNGEGKKGNDEVGKNVDVKV